jgi:hypothetical protein
LRKPAFVLGMAVCSIVMTLCLPAAGAAAGCDPTGTQPVFRGEVPTLADIVPAPGGGGGEVTTSQAYAYMDAVDRASKRVVTGALNKKSWQGREIRWAIVGRASRLEKHRLGEIANAAQRLRDPSTPPGRARRIAGRFPVILWVASSVHGNEESGTDASLRVLYELADRRDCAARQILDSAIVVLLPIQNPDGREADTRRNSYGFDMNRDWFARTQPAVDAKLQMMRRLPGPLFIDAHEQAGTSYFFPPNADPVYHEISDQSISWINDLYGSAMAAEFDRRNIDYSTRGVYDLFYMGYGDTVPSAAFNAAGMTFEKGGLSPISDRAYEQYLTQWVSLSQAAVRKQAVMRRWAATTREAFRQGQRGQLEPNEIVNPGNEVQTSVPERPLRQYFLFRSKDKESEARAIVRRLQRMDVDVYRLRKGVRVPDFTPYGRSPRSRWVPAGTWYVPMAQGQKHWVQAMLNEDTYVPFPYFYDQTAWSQPLLSNVRGGYSGRSLRVKAFRLETLRAPSAPAAPSKLPRIALFTPETVSSAAKESSGWLRYLLDRVWKFPFTSLSAGDIAAGALDGYDVVLIPDGIASIAASQLGAPGSTALQNWEQQGGHLVAWRGGTELAAQLGLTTAVLSDPTSDVPGSLFRVRVDRHGPLARKVGSSAFALYAYDKVMRASSPDRVAVRFPSADSDRWFVSGFASGADELGGTAAVIDEPVGRGRATVFSVEPNFRAYTYGFQKILRNALLSKRAAARAPAAGRVAEARARRAADGLIGNTTTVRLSVPPSDADRAEGVLSDLGLGYRVQAQPDRVAFLIRNPRGLTAEELPAARVIPEALESVDVEPIAFRVP